MMRDKGRAQAAQEEMEDKGGVNTEKLEVSVWDSECEQHTRQAKGAYCTVPAVLVREQ